MIKQSLFELQSSYSILPLRPDHVEFGFGHVHLGAGDILVALRLFGALQGCDVMPGQFHQTAIGGLALRQNSQSADDGCLCLGLMARALPDSFGFCGEKAVIITIWRVG